MRSSGNAASGAQIDLVSQQREVSSEPRAQFLLNYTDFIDYAATEFRRHSGQTRISVVTRKTQRHDRDTRDARKLSREIHDGFLQHFTVVDLGTQNHLGVNFNAGIEHSRQLS